MKKIFIFPMLIIVVYIFFFSGVTAKQLKPKILVITLIDGTNYLFEKASERLSAVLNVDIHNFGFNYGVSKPLPEDISFSNYDAIFLYEEGVLIGCKYKLESAGKTVPLVSINPAFIQGSIDLKEHHWINKYWNNSSEENFYRLLLYIGVKFCGLKMEVKEPIIYPDAAIYHPDRKKVFDNVKDYLNWYSIKTNKHHTYNPEKPTIGIIFYKGTYTSKRTEVVDALIRKIEEKGCNAISLYSHHGSPLTKFFIKEGKSVVDVIISLKCYLNWSNLEQGISEARSVNAPILQAQMHYYKTSEEWENSPDGLALDSIASVVWSELNGIFEPIVVAGKSISPEGGRYSRPIDYQINWRVERAIKWAKLNKMKNSKKKIAIPFYSEHGGGKSNVGADIDAYLDVPASLVKLFKVMKLKGYNIGDKSIPDKKEIARLMSENSNVGTWAKGELKERVNSGNIILIPVEKYLKWFNKLPEEKKNEVIEMYGEPPGNIMIYEDNKKKYIVIPKLEFGNILLLTHPTWGVMQNEKALYNNKALPPHHQYIAFWYWLNKEYNADAVITIFSQISLMPGKQIGLSRYDWGGYLLQDMPAIGPSPLHATVPHNKRRANSLDIDYMTTIVTSGLYEELSGLEKKISLYEQSQGSLKEKYKKGIIDECKELKLDKDINLNPDTINFEEFFMKLKAYLSEIKKEYMPYGSHILSEPPEGDALVEMVESMLSKEYKKHIEKIKKVKSLGKKLIAEVILNKTDLKEAQNKILGVELKNITEDLNLAIEYSKKIEDCKIEIPRILAALEGKYIPPGPQDDPMRNPDVLPTGRNPYNFDPRSFPTKEAWETGKGMANNLLKQHLEKNGKYPEKLSFVLWSCETNRHHGVMESQILFLLGVKPAWNTSGLVIDVEIIPYFELKRPRIDVLVVTSSLYREHFQSKIFIIDKAVRLAAKATDSANYVRKNSQEIKNKLLKSGYEESEASNLSEARIFSEAMGAHSPNLQFAIPAGNTWKDDKKLSDLYINRESYVYGENIHGKQAKEAFVENLKKVEGSVFSRTGNVCGVLDHEMVAAFFGGLKMAVRNTSGKKIDMYIANLRDNDMPVVETLDHFYNRELKSRYFNPKWIKGMMEHGYDGARYMEAFTENLWVWDVTSPDMVTEDMWNDVNDVYINDKYKLNLKEYFDKNNPYALQDMISTMLGAREKDYWHPTKEVLEKLAKVYAESIAKHGVACSYGTCAEPSLHKDVSKLLSAMPDVKPELIKNHQENVDKATVVLEEVKGYEMKEIEEKKEEKSATPKIALATTLIILLIMLVVGRGLWKGMRG